MCYVHCIYRKRNMHYIHVNKVSKLNTVFKNKQTQCIGMNIYKKTNCIIAQDDCTRWRR